MYASTCRGIIYAFPVGKLCLYESRRKSNIGCPPSIPLITALTSAPPRTSCPIDSSVGAGGTWKGSANDSNFHSPSISRRNLSELRPDFHFRLSRRFQKVAGHFLSPLDPHLPSATSTLPLLLSAGTFLPACRGSYAGLSLLRTKQEGKEMLETCKSR